MNRLRKPQLPDSPHWTPEALDDLDAYLTTVIGQARKAQAAAVVAVRLFDDPVNVNMHEYWRNAVGALKWFRGQLRRQRKCREQRPAGTAPYAPRATRRA